MGYRKSKHYNAVFKYVKEKKIALQKDISEIMNGSINTAVEQLENEGRIKRKKVGVRYKNGNLNYQWLVYLTGTNHNELLDFEKELINRPYESPLKEHHCYKKDVITINTENSKVIDMTEYVMVNDYDLSVKEYNGQRVVTFQEIDELHQRPKGTARKRFSDNKQRFVEGVDYYLIKKNQKSELRTLEIPNRGLTLITESGYLLLTKSFTDDLSWEVQRNLVNTYFKMKQLAEQNSIQPIQTGQIQSLDILEMMIKEMKKDRERVDKIENKLNQIVNILAK